MCKEIVDFMENWVIQILEFLGVRDNLQSLLYKKSIFFPDALFPQKLYFVIFVLYSVLGFFIPGFPKLQRFQTHHELILSKLLPKLKKHLVRTSIYQKTCARSLFFSLISLSAFSQSFCKCKS